MIYQNILETIGQTPIIQLQKVRSQNLFVKIESRNPAGSIKDRPAAYMIEQAEQLGDLKTGDTIIEATSGNTGIGLAMVCAVKNYRLILTMSENVSVERQKILRAYGADLVLTPEAEGTVGAIKKAKSLEKEKGYFRPAQHSNPHNPAAHKKTADEIFADFGGDLDILVAATGTGGTISGIGKFLKEKMPHLKIVATEPLDSPVLSQKIFHPHKIMATAPGFIPEILDENIYEEVVSIATEEAYTSARFLAREEGILVGISSGAVFAGMKKVAEQYPGKNILGILPDGGERYLSTDLFSTSEA